MQTSYLLPLALLLAVPAAVPQLPVSASAAGETAERAEDEVDLVLAPSPGTRLRRTIETMTRMDLTDATMEIDGEVLGEDEFEVGDESSEESFSLVVMDHYAGFDGEGELVRLDREYELIEVVWSEEAVWEDGEESTSGEGASGLEGLTVTFEWDDDEENYLPEFGAESSGDEDLLEGVDIEMDLDWFLPEESVKVGAVWEVDAWLYEHTVTPGGDLAIVMEYENDGADFEDVDDEYYGGDEEQAEGEEPEWDGTIRCELVAVEEVGGRPRARIELDLGVELIATGEMSDSDDEGDFSLTWEETETHELKGELIWDLSENVAVSLELSGEATTAFHTVTEWTSEDEQSRIVDDERHTGAEEITYHIERVD